MAVVRATLILSQSEIRRTFTDPASAPRVLVARLADRTAERARAEAPARTGALRNSIQAEPTTLVGDTIRGGVRAAAEYGIFVHEGTKAHPIVARRAKALRFVMNGRVVYAKSVQHPGTKPNRFFLRALNAEAPRLGFRVEPGR